MEIPKIDIEAMCDYIEADLEMGVQMNFSDWRESLAKVREWLGAVEHSVQSDGSNVPQIGSLEQQENINKKVAE